MAYVGFTINSHICYDNTDENTFGNWIFNGTASFNNNVSINGTTIMNGDFTANYPVVYNSTFGCNGDISSTGNNTWEGQQTVTGNIVSSGNNTFNGINTFTSTLYATAYNALYGDIAELYEIDFDFFNKKDYNQGKYKGYLAELSSKKTIKLTKPNSKKCIGILSGKPGFIMNDKLSSKKYIAPIAYLGRVDCYILGKVKAGDKLTTSKLTGIAKKMTLWDKLFGKPVVAMALEDKIYDEVYQIEVLVK